MTYRLIGIRFSPWSIRARWALDLRGVPYRYTEYLPMLGEPWLRVRTRRLRGKVSVPVLLADGRAIMDSLAIARLADDHGDPSGDAPRLFPADRDDEITAWNDAADRFLAASRVLALRAALARPDVLRESLPRGLRGVPGAGALARTVAGYVLRKYAVDGTDDALEARMRDELLALRAALAGRDHLLGELTYADIVMAVALSGVELPAGDLARLGPHSREAWRRDRLAAEFADLVAWRDAFYDRHHPRRRPAAA